MRTHILESPLHRRYRPEHEPPSLVWSWVAGWINRSMLAPSFAVAHQVSPAIPWSDHSYLDNVGQREEACTVKVGTRVTRAFLPISDCPRTGESDTKFLRLKASHRHQSQRRYQWWPTQKRECTTCHCRQEVSPGPGQKIVSWCVMENNSQLTNTHWVPSPSFININSCPILFLDLFLQITPQYACDACYVSTGIRLQQAFKSPSTASLHLICSGKYCLSWQQKQAPYHAKGHQRSPIFWRSSLMTLHASQALPLWWFIHNKWLAWWRVRTLWANMPTGLSFIHQVSNGLWLQRLWSNWPNGPASSLAWKNARHREDSWSPERWVTWLTCHVLAT